MDMRVRISKISFVHAERMYLFIDWAHDDFDAQDIGNASVNIFKINPERNAFAFGFGAQANLRDNELVLSGNIPSTMQHGLYAVTSIRVTEVAGHELPQPISLNFAPIYFEVRPHFRNAISEQKLVERLNNIMEKRLDYINTIHITENANGDENLDQFFAVVIFGVGCLIHARQQLKGYRIDPLELGLSHSRFLEIVNSYLSSEEYDPLPFREETESDFERSTPTISITFPRVQAADHVDAIEHCRRHCDRVFQLLGMERGQIPREFAYLAMKHGTTLRWHGFEMPGYRGNLISDINPTQLAENIEKKLPTLESNPFARLLVRSFAEATGERDFGFQILRYWTVLELAADRSIITGQSLTHPDGNPILKPNGRQETTGSKHGRVYEYIRLAGSFSSLSHLQNVNPPVQVLVGDTTDSRYQQGMIVVSLWDMILATYAVRCRVAHEGFYDISMTSSPGEILASNFISRGYPDILRFSKEQARMTIWRET